MSKQLTKDDPIETRLIVKGPGLDIDVTVMVWERDDTDMIEELLATVRASAGVRRVIRGAGGGLCIQCGLPTDAPIHTGGHPTRCHAPVTRVAAIPEKGGR